MKFIKRFLCILLVCFIVFSCMVCCSGQSADELVKNVVFSFRVKSNGISSVYSITVTNNTNLDIVKFCVCDKQYNGEKEKGGTLDFRPYPFGQSTDCLVPSGGTEVFEPSKIMWNDCDKVVNYVYYIEFSDGTVWGKECYDFATVESFGLKYETPFEIEEENAYKSTFNSTDLQNRTRNRVRNGILGLLFFFVFCPIVIVCAILKKQRKKNKKYKVNRDNQNASYNNYPNKMFIYRNKVTKTSNYQAEYEPNNTVINNAYENIRNNYEQTKEESTKKGKIGEYFAYEKINQIPGEKRLLHNVYIPKANGRTTEIDCLMIHQKGIFVIEAKNYSGHIYGSPYDERWTQVLNRESHYSFYNPIRQNNGHINNLLNYLSYHSQDKYGKVPVYSLISFGPNADISNVNQGDLQNKNIYVINTEKIDVTITSIINSITQDYCSQKDVEEIYNILFPLVNVTKEEKEKHIDSIRYPF